MRAFISRPKQIQMGLSAASLSVVIAGLAYWALSTWGTVDVDALVKRQVKLEAGRIQKHLRQNFNARLAVVGSGYSGFGPHAEMTYFSDPDDRGSPVNTANFTTVCQPLGKDMVLAKEQMLTLAQLAPCQTCPLGEAPTVVYNSDSGDGSGADEVFPKAKAHSLGQQPVATALCIEASDLHLESTVYSGVVTTGHEVISFADHAVLVARADEQDLGE